MINACYSSTFSFKEDTTYKPNTLIISMIILKEIGVLPADMRADILSIIKL